MARDKREILGLIGETVDLLVDYRGKLLTIEESLADGEEPDVGKLAKNLNGVFKGLTGKELKRFTSDQAKDALARLTSDLMDLHGANHPEGQADHDPGAAGDTLYCSFCGKSQHEVKKLIAGPSVFICEECTELCMMIIREENPPAAGGPGKDPTVGGS